MKRRIGLSPGAKLRVLKRDRFTCTYCGVSGVDAELHVDHIIPVSKGGSNNLHNLTTACSQCNLKKSNKIYADPRQGKEYKPELRQRWRIENPQSRWLEKAEVLLLRIYLHCPEYRPEINQALISKDLLFSFSHHRLLWQQIDAVSTQCWLPFDAENQLMEFVQDRYAEQRFVFWTVQSIFQLTESTVEELMKADCLIPQAIAVMEKVGWQKYGQHCLKELQKYFKETPKFNHYQQEWLKARQEINRLDAIRLSQFV